MTTQNVLYLSYDGLTDPLGQSQILPYLEGLSKEYSITLITFEKKDRFVNDSDIHKKTAKACIHWIPLMYHKRPPVLSTLFDLFVLWRTVKDVLKNKKIHLVHCRSYITSLIGLKLKKRKEIPFLFDMRGFWADERVEGRLWNLKNPFYKMIYRLFKYWEKEFVLHADSVITLTHSGQKEVLSWNKNSDVEIIPCCVDEVLFDPESINSESKEKLRDELGLSKDDFVLIYSGSLSTWYLADEMMKFYSVLRKYRMPSKFILLTSDSNHVPKSEWENEIITRYISRDKMPLYLSIADASVFFIKDSYSKKGSSATKMAELMAMNIPFITNSGWGDVDEIVTEENAGLLLSSLNEESFVMASKKIIKTLGPSRPFVKKYFSLGKGIAHYSNVYSRIIK